MGAMVHMVHLGEPVSPEVTDQLKLKGLPANFDLAIASSQICAYLPFPFLGKADGYSGLCASRWKPARAV